MKAINMHLFFATWIRISLLPRLHGMSVREMFWYKIPTTETANLVFVSNSLDNDLKVEVEWLKPIFVEFIITTVHTAIFFAI